MILLIVSKDQNFTHDDHVFEDISSFYRPYAIVHQNWLQHFTFLLVQ